MKTACRCLIHLFIYFPPRFQIMTVHLPLLFTLASWKVTRDERHQRQFMFKAKTSSKAWNLDSHLFFARRLFQGDPTGHRKHWGSLIPNTSEKCGRILADVQGFDSPWHFHGSALQIAAAHWWIHAMVDSIRRPVYLSQRVKYGAWRADVCLCVVIRFLLKEFGVNEFHQHPLTVRSSI